MPKLDLTHALSTALAFLAFLLTACTGPTTPAVSDTSETPEPRDVGPQRDTDTDDLGTGLTTDSLGDLGGDGDADEQDGTKDTTGHGDKGATEDTTVRSCFDVADTSDACDVPSADYVDIAAPEIGPADASVDSDLEAPDNGPADAGDSDAGGSLPDLTPLLCEGEDGSVLPAPPYDPCEPEPEPTTFALEPEMCPPVEPAIGSIAMPVSLEPLYVNYDESCLYGPCGDYGIKGLLPLGEHDVVVVGAAAVDFADGLKMRPRLARLDKFGATKWTLELGDAADATLYYWVDAATLTHEGNILVLAASNSSDGSVFAIDRWLIDPDGTLLHEESAPKWDSDFYYRSATGVSPGAIAAGTRFQGLDDPPGLCGYRSLTRIDESGITLWDRTYSSAVAKPGGPADWISMSVVSVPGCGFAVVAPSHNSPTPIHVLRLNGAGDPVARWVYEFEKAGGPEHVYSGVAGGSLVVAVPRRSEPGWGYIRPTVLRIDPSTGEALSLLVLEGNPDFYRYPVAVLGSPSGVVLLSDGEEFPSVAIDGSPAVHLLAPIGCPVASYAFPGLKGNLGKLVAGLRLITRLGDGTFAGVDVTDIYAPHSTHVYFFELPAVAELEASFGGGGP